MVKVLNREGIQRMVGRGAGSGGSGGSSGGGGGISIAQVDAAYVSKAFFDQLFTVHGKRTYTDPETQEEVTEDVIISPNQIAEGEYSLSNVEVSVGLWTNSFLSALGLNSGGGGGGATALSELVDVALSNPQNGQALVYDSASGKWVNGTVTPDLSDYATKAWVQQQGYITSSALTGYATQSWVQQQGYIKSSALEGYLPLSGGTMTGDLHLGSSAGASPYIYFGDSSYVYIVEDADDHLTVKGAKGINLVVGSGYNVTINSANIATQSWVQQQGYLTQHQSLAGYATQSWVQQQGYLTSHQSVDGTFWGQSWNNHGSVSGNMENVDIIFQTGNNILMHQHGIGLMIEGSAVTGNEYRASFGFHPAGSLSWLYTNTVMQLKVNTTTGENFVHINNGILQIGDARLVWDSANNALKVVKADGSAANFYATGGISALGMSS